LKNTTVLAFETEFCGTTPDSSATAQSGVVAPIDTTRALVVFVAIPEGVERDNCGPAQWPLPVGGLGDIDVPVWADSLFEDTDDLSGSWEPTSEHSLTRYFWDLSNGGDNSQRKLSSSSTRRSPTTRASTDHRRPTKRAVR
jgi:hypothetical protein